MRARILIQPPPTVAEFELSWHPALAETVVKSFTIETELRSPDVKWTVDGKDYPFGANGSLRLEVRDQYVFRDEIEAIGAAHPLKLSRTYDSLDVREDLRCGADAEPAGTVRSCRTDLAGKMVLFSWEDSTKEWKRTLAHHEQLDPKILQTLEENLDFRAFVPGKSVATDGDVLVVGRLLCHRSIASTATYARPTEARVRAAMSGT